MEKGKRESEEKKKKKNDDDDDVVGERELCLSAVLIRATV